MVDPGCRQDLNMNPFSTNMAMVLLMTGLFSRLQIYKSTVEHRQ